MVDLIATVGAEGVSVGVGGSALVIVLSLLIKKGVTGTFSIGNGGGGKKAVDNGYITEMQCRKAHEDLERRMAEIRTAEEKRQDERHEETQHTLAEIKGSILSVHQRIDNLYQHGVGPK